MLRCSMRRRRVAREEWSDGRPVTSSNSKLVQLRLIVQTYRRFADLRRLINDTKSNLHSPKRARAIQASVEFLCH